jgi:pimeloyl-ACP methyl ester carboxylesterase
VVERQEIDVPVDGGLMRVGVWGPKLEDAPVVLAVHGITASHVCWELLARQLPHARVVAPDLRGRGRSADLPGPWGMARHAEDLAHVLDGLGIGAAFVVGHSMGGVVSVVFRHRHPARVRGLLLADGGLPVPMPPGMTAEQAVQAVLGPALARLSMTFPDREAYRAFWRAHPALAADWGPAAVAYVDYDLVGAEPALASSARPDAVREDSVDLLEGAALPDALAALASEPLTLVRAPRGLQDEPPGLYPEPHLEALATRLPGLRWRTVPAVNHYTMLLSEPGAGAVADEVRALLASR